MQPAASLRHPWKAIAAIIATFALVHGAGAHVFSSDHDHERSRVVIGHALHADADCTDDEADHDADIDMDFGPNFPFFDEGPGEPVKADPYDHNFN
jgi:hypothetical protein